MFIRIRVLCVSVNTSQGTPQIVFTCDNARMFYPRFILDGEEVSILGVVEMVVPIDRNSERLPEEICDECHRLHREDGTRNAKGTVSAVPFGCRGQV